MIAIKEKDCVYFASPMGIQTYFTQIKADYSCEENSDIWHLNDEEGTIVMVSANNRRIIDMLRYSDAFECEFSRKGMCEAIRRVKYLLDCSNSIAPKDKMGLIIMIARGNTGYRISTYGAVFELHELECIDESDERMMVAYHMCKDIPDVCARIKAMYTIVSKLCPSNPFPLHIINTKNGESVLIEQ